MKLFLCLALLTQLLGVIYPQQQPSAPPGISVSVNSASTPPRPSPPPGVLSVSVPGVAFSFSNRKHITEKWIYSSSCSKWAKVYADVDTPSVSCPAVFLDPNFSKHDICSSNGELLYGSYAGSSIWTYPFAYCSNLPYIMCPALRYICQDTSPTCLSSQGYPRRYSSNLLTYQTLRVPAGQSIVVTFEDLDVEGPSQHGDGCPYDYLQFLDEERNVVGGKLCGNFLPSKITIFSSTATVLFKTDKNIGRKGYKFCYKPVRCS